jgi:hypothetical protein
MPHDLPLGTTDRTIALDARTMSERSVEVGMHELGESLAASVVAVQDELARYAGPLGRHVLDEVCLTLPVDVRVDSFGQLVVRTRDPGRPGGDVTLRLRPKDGPPIPVPAPVDLSQMSSLTFAEVEALNEHRIFSVEDLMRVGRNPSGQAALRKIRRAASSGSFDAVFDEAELLTLPLLPRAVSELMPSVGIRSCRELSAADPKGLAVKLTERIGQEVTPEDVSSWQRELGDVGRIPLPKHRAKDEPDSVLAK